MKIIYSLAAVALLTGCGSGSSQPAATRAPVATRAPTAQTPDPLGNEICTVTDGSATYYLAVTSMTAHNLSLCNGSPRYRGTIDDLLTITGMDRRCYNDVASEAQLQAVVAVYSDSAPGNAKAANAFCRKMGAEPGSGPGG